MLQDIYFQIQSLSKLTIMALPSSRQNTKVNPDAGVFVEMEGIIELRVKSDDMDYEEPQAEDLYLFQSKVDLWNLDPHFCIKNKQTKEQKVFLCLLCNSEFTSVRTLRDHVLGKKHIG